MSTERTPPPWEEAARALTALAYRPSFGELCTAILDACNAHASQVTRERDEARAGEELSNHEICQLEDWLCGNAVFDKNGLIDKAARCKERIRDLIAAEGEVGDLKAENASLRAQVERMQHIIETAIRFIKGTPANHQERLGLIVLAEKLGDALSTTPAPAMGKSQQ